MAATIHKNFFANAVFVPYPNGDIFAFRGQLIPFEGATVEFYFHQAAADGPDLYTKIDELDLGEELDLIYDFLSFAGMWNSPVPGSSPPVTWNQIANTNNYVSPYDGITYTPGTECLIVAMRDWLIVHTPRDCENATDTRWLHQFLITQKIQPAIARALAKVQVPVIPPVFVGPTFNPTEVGRIHTIADLFIAQSQRFTGTLSGGTIVVGTKPIP